MTTNNHTAITTGAAANASVVNAPLGQLDEKLGNVAGALTTTTKISAVAAINELDAEHGVLSSLTTTAKNTFVAAINEVDANADTANTSIGTLASLLTTAKTNLVAAINEVIGYIGTLASLTTTAKSSAVAAINELDGEIGTLSSLTTTAQNNLVAAINEVDGQLDDYLEGPIVSITAAATISTSVGKSIYRISGGTNISTINPVNASWSKVIFLICNGSWDLVTGGNIEKEYVPALNEVVVLVFDDIDNTWKFAHEDFSLLNTTDQSSLVKAINEVNTLAGWNKATTANKTASTTVTLTAGIARYNMSGVSTIQTISAPAGSPTVIYLMDNGDGNLSINYGADNIFSGGHNDVTAHTAFEVVCLVYNDSTTNWQRVF